MEDVTLRQLVYDIGNLKSGGIQSDDEMWSNRQKAFAVMAARAILAKRDLDKDRLMQQGMMQTLECVEVIQVPSYECCGLSSECSVLRTKEKLPRIVATNDGIALNYIGSPNNFDDFAYIQPHRVKWSIHDPHVGYMRKVTMVNDYAYIINDEELESISIRAIFENPISASSKFKSNPNCNSWDAIFPFPAHLILPMKQEIAKLDLEILRRSIPDETNDANGFLNTK